ncbi:MAG: hypothetical protein FD181_2752 [Prolixibacteraceae bacterium]|nr:MAG: hypothetical protein FD181_2752 [Prolixibacteraceae bacterium]
MAGRLKAEARGFTINITDHLGNVRAEITPYIGGAPLVTQARNYYTFGMLKRSGNPDEIGSDEPVEQWLHHQ